MKNENKFKGNDAWKKDSSKDQKLQNTNYNQNNKHDSFKKEQSCQNQNDEKFCQQKNKNQNTGKHEKDSNKNFNHDKRKAG